MALMNGLIGETDSLFKAILTTMDEGLTKLHSKLTSSGKKIEVEGGNQLEKIGETLRNMLGLLVLVPSNPEGQFFQIVNGILNFLQKEEWGTSPLVQGIKVKVLDSCVRYLAS